MLELTEYLKFFVTLVSLVDPVGTIPLFISLTVSQSVAERRQTATVAAVAVVALLIGALLAGELVLTFFGISMAAFQVAGGLLLLLMAIPMLQARVSPARQTDEETAAAVEDAIGPQHHAVAVVPLAMPLLAGPGAISGVILYAHRGENALHYLWMAVVIVVVALLVWLSFRAAGWVGRVLRQTGINVVTRIMGLIVTAIGVEFIAAGARQLLPGLG